jgi:hypothetical protein
MAYKFLAPAGLLIGAVLAAPVMSQTVTAADPPGVVSALQGFGYKATLETDSAGDPVIRSATEGRNFSIWFYGCNDAGADCNGLNFSSGFDLDTGTTLEVVNDWNSTKLVGYAYLDEEMDPYLTYFVITEGGISLALFEEVMARWSRSIADFKDLVNF